MANDTDDIETQLEDAAGIKSESDLKLQTWFINTFICDLCL